MLNSLLEEHLLLVCLFLPRLVDKHSLRCTSLHNRDLLSKSVQEAREAPRQVASRLHVSHLATRLELAVTSDAVPHVSDLLRLSAVLTDLRFFVLDIGSDFAVAIAEALKVNEVMNTITLDGDGNGFPLPVKQLKGTEPVEAFDFSGKGLGTRSAIVIAKLIEFNAVLSSLNISDNFIGPELGIAMAEMLKVNEALTDLNLAFNNIGPDGTVAIASILKLNAGLTSLNLAGNQLCGVDEFGSGTYDASVIDALAAALAGSKVLTSIDVGYNRLDEEAALALVRAVRPRDQMARLGLQNCRIGATGATEIAEYVRGSKVMKVLDLSLNNIGDDDGAKALASALEVNAGVTHLNLNGNAIGDQSATAIAGALQVNAVLHTLCMFDNCIGNAGAIAIAEALKVNAVMAVLDLQGNNIGDPGAIAIAKALEVNAVLHTLALYRNNIDDAGAIAIAEALKFNTSLTMLILADNSIGEVAKGALRASVQGRQGFDLRL